MNPRSNIYRALMTNPGFAVALDERRGSMLSPT
jgi:hypothetical protein